MCSIKCLQPGEEAQPRQPGSGVDDGYHPCPGIDHDPGPGTQEQSAGRFKRTCLRFIKVNTFHGNYFFH